MMIQLCVDSLRSILNTLIRKRQLKVYTLISLGDTYYNNFQSKSMKAIVVLIKKGDGQSLSKLIKPNTIYNNGAPTASTVQSSAFHHKYGCVSK